jgi:hypothetical protein
MRETPHVKRIPQQLTRLPAGDGAAERSRRLSDRAVCPGLKQRGMPLRAVRGSRGIRVVDEGDDTLTESCEGAINFMVVEVRVGSLHDLPFDDVIEVGFGRMVW